MEPAGGDRSAARFRAGSRIAIRLRIAQVGACARTRLRGMPQPGPAPSEDLPSFARLTFWQGKTLARGRPLARIFPLLLGLRSGKGIASPPPESLWPTL